MLSISRPRVLIDDKGFEFAAPDCPEVSVPFSAITKIEIYKRDEISSDLICLDIFHEAPDGPHVLFLHEELEGYDDLLKCFAKLPGFDSSWPRKVVTPAFAENRTVVYDRERAREAASL